MTGSPRIARWSLLLLMACAGCNLQGGSPEPVAIPIAPSPGRPQGSPVSGRVVVLSDSGPMPLASQNISMWVDQGRQGDARSLRTDAAGRFSLTVLPETAYRLFVTHPGHRQPCLTTLTSADTEKDVQLVADADVPRAADLLGASAVAPLRGVVFETTAAGRRPIAGAGVDVDGIGGDGVLLAATVADANGRYFLCGLTSHPRPTVVAFKSGYQTASVNASQIVDGTLDIELKRLQ